MGFLLSATFVFSSATTFAFAEEEGTGALLNDPFNTPEVEQEFEKIRQEKEKFIESLKSEMSRGVSRSAVINHPITLQKQETGYWCGPASARVALSFHKAISGSSHALPTQSTLAKKIGTTTDGSSSTGIAKALNSDYGKYGHFSYAVKKYDKTHPYNDWYEKVYTMLKGKQTTPINLVQTDYMKRYLDENKRIRHYITISGWNKGDTVRTNDPNYDNRFYGSRWEAIGSGSALGIFKASWEADKRGSNHGLIY